MMEIPSPVIVVQRSSICKGFYFKKIVSDMTEAFHSESVFRGRVTPEVTVTRFSFF
jgi:hypothetical protein